MPQPARRRLCRPLIANRGWRSAGSVAVVLPICVSPPRRGTASPRGTHRQPRSATGAEGAGRAEALPPAADLASAGKRQNHRIVGVGRDLCGSSPPVLVGLPSTPARRRGRASSSLRRRHHRAGGQTPANRRFPGWRAPAETTKNDAGWVKSNPVRFQEPARSFPRKILSPSAPSPRRRGRAALSSAPHAPAPASRCSEKRPGCVSAARGAGLENNGKNQKKQQRGSWRDKAAAAVPAPTRHGQLFEPDTETEHEHRKNGAKEQKTGHQLVSKAHPKYLQGHKFGSRKLSSRLSLR